MSPRVALVGYTNAGKSTLLQRWTADYGEKAELRGHDRLFDTLDPLARKVRTRAGAELVLLDTVGFVQDLPHLLVEAFRATLEEVLAADLIVHVVDASTPTEARLATTYQVLAEIGALDKPVITLYNKMDLAPVQPPPDLRAVVTVYGSATAGADSIQTLYEAVERELGVDPVRLRLRGPADTVLSAQVVQRGRMVDVHPVSADTLEATVVVPRRWATSVMEELSPDARLAVEWMAEAGATPLPGLPASSSSLGEETQW